MLRCTSLVSLYCVVLLQFMSRNLNLNVPNDRSWNLRYKFLLTFLLLSNILITKENRKMIGDVGFCNP